ncbi:universal stress protein [Mycobacterium antarcticum]|uniref:universal stress protein n=1 Tax=Mycolicibacterium sp. TUM20983 TaxID=3023369 RepID=UPI0023A78B9B|nr:universal stress protein [Mycolicibacterium sp. TUM20983]GLP76770.1 universal stress protein [Mycolicibacterium sp. TUM20983]
MQDTHQPSPCVVVGIDGSRAGVTAALWAVDEAVQRDVPLRLLYAIEPSADSDEHPDVAAGRLATAELAIRYAFAAVEATDEPVKIEVEILQERPTVALLRASRTAAMLCVGAIGLRHTAMGRLGSTAAMLASSAQCPVAIIRGTEAGIVPPRPVVVEVDEMISCTNVLQLGIAEARLRGAPLRVLTTWQSRFTDIHDARAVSDGNRRAKAQLDRRLSWWIRRNPDVDIKPVVAHCSTLNYLSNNAKKIQLVVVGRERSRGLGDVVGAGVEVALHDSGCSVLVCEPHNAL